MFVPWDIRRTARSRAAMELPCHRCGRAAEHALCEVRAVVTVAGARVARIPSGQVVECRRCGIAAPVSRSHFEQLVRRSHAAAAPDWVAAPAFGTHRPNGSVTSGW
ncbi:hypothetical protein [Nocardia bovistercoris]|uniref:Uncharacterized protein n=1 Tax=Nocardia bovistercoris TaxID=2785916 RepID=A0A931I9J9_9NOCA|nr:hypothetical protein [Nocardia bovistercoris]MBH0777234.1 hypothetical protein [Nocardia bovistercoris]